MQNIEIPIREAAYPVPFEHALEFNPPVHETWNIVHIGMNIPECQQIYVCAINCMRGVVLTAAEMNRAERFSFVILKEEDLLEGTVEDITIEGVKDVICKLPKRPPAVTLFTVCTHHFLGCDINRIYRELEAEFPDIDFIRGWMDPIMQKEGLTPDQKLRIAMYRVLRDERSKTDKTADEKLSCAGTADGRSENAGTADDRIENTVQEKDRVRKKKVALIGSNVSLGDHNDLKRILDDAGIEFIQMTDTKSYEEYKALGQADLFLGVVPNSKLPVQLTSDRLQKEGMYLPMSFSFHEIRKQQEMLMDWICPSTEYPDMKREKWFIGETTSCGIALKKARQIIGDAPVWIDYVVHPRPLGLARLLLIHGFRVEKIFLNAVSTEEEADFKWLKEHAPELIFASTIQPMNRVHPRGCKEKLLAIGPQAAWFGATGHFVNMVEGGDLYGFDGIRQLAALMVDAWLEEKDTRDLVPRKGLGCESCV